MLRGPRDWLIELLPILLHRGCEGHLSSFLLPIRNLGKVKSGRTHLNCKSQAYRRLAGHVAWNHWGKAVQKKLTHCSQASDSMGLEQFRSSFTKIADNSPEKCHLSSTVGWLTREPKWFNGWACQTGSGEHRPVRAYSKAILMVFCGADFQECKHRIGPRKTHFQIPPMKSPQWSLQNNIGSVIISPQKLSRRVVVVVKWGRKNLDLPERKVDY